MARERMKGKGEGKGKEGRVHLPRYVH